MFILFRHEVRFRRKPKKPCWCHTPEWEGVCPQCGPFDQDDAKCPLDDSDLVVRRSYVERPAELKNFFLKAFRFSRMVGKQELRCSANCGFSSTVIECPDCGEAIGGSYLLGMYLAPRLILYVPFVLVLSLGAVRATAGLAFIFFPYVSSFFGWIYRLLFCHSFFPWPLRYLFNKEVAFSFYETNDAPGL
jgi:hypothetical protein